MALLAPVLWLWPYHHLVALDLKRGGEACRETMQLVELRLFRGDGAGDRFVLRVMSYKGKGDSHERCIFYGHVQHQADTVGMCATAVSGFEREAPNTIEDRLVLVYLDPERHV